MRTGSTVDFAAGDRTMSGLLGGKGANLAELTRLLGADMVPDGFTVTTEACNRFLESGDMAAGGLLEDITAALARLRERHSADSPDSGGMPLLLSIRSGAPVSMPGMMDTVLDVGICEANFEALVHASGSERFAWDSRRRLVQMYSTVVDGTPGGLFEDALQRACAEAGVDSERMLDAASLKAVCHEFMEIHERATGERFPDDPDRQMTASVAAVFRSWNGTRATAYRRLHRIPDALGTAVNVQRMVFGNVGSDSGSGVAFSRNATDGSPSPSGDFLSNAQGEDVVAGDRLPLPLDALKDSMAQVHGDLVSALRTIEAHFGDMQDVEFTVERGRLWILQSRTAQRPPRASVRFACDAVAEGLLSRESALMTIDPGTIERLLHPSLVRPIADSEVIARGVAASPGSASGELCFTAGEAAAASAAGRSVVLVRRRTDAEDVVGFQAAAGVLTQTGGSASHAALVARGMGRPCVCGVADLAVDEEAGTISVDHGGRTMHAGDTVTIDGSNGLVTDAAIPVAEHPLEERLERVLEWADAVRRLGVRANADTPSDVARSVRFGAEGVGLCRTEHMFRSAERQHLIREAILGAPGEPQVAEALSRLGDLQRSDFEAMFAACGRRPITIRLLDPPLHEFLRSPDDLRALIENGDADGSLGRELAMTLELQESNPMLGLRGVRLGLLRPDIYAMQAKAIAQAVVTATIAGRRPRLGVMVPLVEWEAELGACRAAIVDAMADEGLVDGADFEVGTMIELPRACLAAGDLARSASFFSFGTNDLTQTSLGLSRDDVEATVIRDYVDRGLIPASPFSTLDAVGVGGLIDIAIASGRRTRPDLSIGVCGEHGGDAESIAWFDRSGVDYVSCSPYRVPAARIAAAQAAIGSTNGDAPHSERWPRADG